MDPLTAVESIINLVVTVQKKRKQVGSLREEVETFCSLLDNLHEILLDVRKALGEDEQRDQEHTSLRKPLQDLKRAIKKGKSVVDECTNLKKLQAFIFSGEYLRTLRQAANEIKECLQSLQTAGIVLQVGTLNKIELVSSMVSQLGSKIEEHHNELKELITRNADSSERRIKEMEILLRSIVSNPKDLHEQAQEIAANAQELRSAKGFAENTMLEWALRVSEIPDSIICPISLDVMEDPVLVLESGITYDHKHLCSSLLEHPDLEPVTRTHYDKMLNFAPNLTVRNMLMEQYGDSAFKKYGNPSFRTQYRKAWEEKVAPPGQEELLSEEMHHTGDEKIIVDEEDDNDHKKPGKNRPSEEQHGKTEEPNGDHPPEEQPRCFKKKWFLVAGVVVVAIVVVVLVVVIVGGSGSGSDSNDNSNSTQRPSTSPGENSQLNQLGQSISGGNSDNFGWSVALSDSGRIAAAGAPSNLASGTEEKGYVRVFVIEGGSQWAQWGNDIEGDAPGDYFGFSVALSSDGSICAVGAPFSSGNGAELAGAVRVFRFSGSQWNELGMTIYGKTTGNGMGWSVALSSDGATLATGAPFHSGDNGSFSGAARVYGLSGSRWDQLGQDIEGKAAEDLFGSQVALSPNGNILAVGASQFNATRGNRLGYASVFQRNTANRWSQIGQDIDGRVSKIWSVALSDNGGVVAMGSPSSEADKAPGVVRVFAFNDGGRWNQLGRDIVGSFSEDDWFGYSLGLSASGTILAVGAPVGGDGGYISLFQFGDGQWTQIGTDIGSGSSAIGMGFSTALAPDGTSFAAGVVSGAGTGQLQVFSYE